MSYKKRTSKDKEIKGIIMMAVSVVLALFLILPLGIVSDGIRTIFLSIFGWSSIGLLTAVFVAGAMMLMGRSLGLKPKIVAGVCIIVFSSLIILQLITAHSHMGDGFAAYMGGVFRSRNTAGGVVMGIFAYGFAAGMGRPFSFVVLSIAIIISCLLFVDIKAVRSKGEAWLKGRRNSDSGLKRRKDVPELVGEEVVMPRIAAKTPIAGNNLHIDTIIPNTANSSKAAKPQSNHMRPVPVSMPLNNFGYTSSNIGIVSNVGGLQRPLDTKSEDELDQERKKRARETFYTNQYAFLQEGKKTEISLGTSRVEIPSSIQATPDTRQEPTPEHVINRPPKIIHSQPTGLSDISVAPAKRVEMIVNPGEIINGDELSKELVEKGSDTAKSFGKTDSGKTDFGNGAAVPGYSVAYGPSSSSNIISTSATVSAVASQPTRPIHIEPGPIVNGETGEATMIIESIKRGAPISNLGSPSRVLTEQSANTLPPIIDNSPKHNNAAPKPTPTPRAVPKRDETNLSELIDGERQLKERLFDVKETTHSNTTIDKPKVDITYKAIDADSFDNQTDKSHDNPKGFLFEELGNNFAQANTANDNDDVIDKTEYNSHLITDVDNDRTGEYLTKKNRASGSTGAKQLKFDYERVAVPSVDTAPIAKKPRKRLKYNYPSTDLLDNNPVGQLSITQDELDRNVMALERTLARQGFPTVEIIPSPGPSVTRYEVKVEQGVSIKNIGNCATDIAYELASKGSIRIESPIPGKQAVGIEVPNSSLSIVGLRGILESREFVTSKSPLAMAIGQDISGGSVVGTLNSLTQLLVAGATGSGKSACLNSLIVSLIFKASPDDVRLLLIDPKMVEMSRYEGLPHLLVDGIVTEPAQALNAFDWAIDEMERRYRLMLSRKVSDVVEYNSLESVVAGETEHLPYIVIIVDELADLMSMSKRDFEDRIIRLAQKARAAGIHLILATQRPSVNVVTGLIKANLPSRIAFQVVSQVDSRTILDSSGAECLLGKGDMLYKHREAFEPKRVQGCFVAKDEVDAVVKYVIERNTEYEFDEDAKKAIFAKKEEIAITTDDGGEEGEDEGDAVLLTKALKRVVDSGQASATMLQSRFRLGYAKAKRIIDQMEDRGFIGPPNGAKPREVKITKEMFVEMFGDIEE